MKANLNRLRSFFAFIFVNLTALTCFSQPNPTYQIVGTVLDSTSAKPLAFSTVSLINVKSETLNVIVTQDDGSFVFTGLQPELYTISISSIGYANCIIKADLIHSTTHQLTLSNIKLTRQIKMLNEVAIKSARAVVQRKADRMIYDLRADPESKGNNVLTIMRKVPYLSLDGDDNLLLKGNSSFKVMINGKPSKSLENNLKSVLKSIPASTIERIEVIPVPPSRYDAEGLAGIINIITIKQVSNGYNGSLNLGESGPVGGPIVGASFTAKSGKFGFSANGGSSINDNPATYNSSVRLSLGTDRSILTQLGSQKSNDKTAYFATELSYQIDSLHLLTAQLNYNGSSVEDRAAQSSDLSGDQVQRYTFINDGKATIHGIDAGINYEIRSEGKKNQLLTLSYLLNTNQNDRSGDLDFDQQFNFSTSDFQQNDRQEFKEHSFQVDFNTPLNIVTIEAGLKGILRTNESDFLYRSFNTSNDQFELNPGLSNEYTNTQNVFSAYNSYQINFNSWNVYGGVRIEETVIRADFLSTGTVADQNNLNIIPSLSVAKQLKDGSSVNLGFSQRIRRPGINRLNPYVDRSNPNYELTGNPNLRPVVLNDIQLGYGTNKKVSVNFGFNYSFMNNLDLQVVNFDPASQITQITYANTGKSSSIGLNFNFGYALGTYKVSLNGNTIFFWLSGQVNGTKIENNLLMYSSTLSNVVRLKHGWALNADFSVNSHSPTGLQGRTNGFFYTAFNFNKEIVKDKFAISGGIKNPFTKYRYVVNKTFGPDFTQGYQTNNYFRSFNINLNYTFGALKDRVSRNKVGIKNNDIAN